MTPKMLLTLAIEPAMTLLPEKMNTPDAIRMMVAIAKQESDLKHRHQVGGPAHGPWQFERNGGMKGVLNHPATRAHARRACELMIYDPDDLDDVFAGLEHNFVLAAVFARLLLWTLPAPLPQNQYEGFAQYIDAWRPGAWFRGNEEKRLGLKRRWVVSWAAGEVALT